MVGVNVKFFLEKVFAYNLNELRFAIPSTASVLT